VGGDTTASRGGLTLAVTPPPGGFRMGPFCDVGATA